MCVGMICSESYYGLHNDINMDFQVKNVSVSQHENVSVSQHGWF